MCCSQRDVIAATLSKQSLKAVRPEIRNPKLKILQAYDERLAAQTAGIDQRPLTQKAGFRFPERLCRILWLIRFLLRDFRGLSNDFCSVFIKVLIGSLGLRVHESWLGLRLVCQVF